MKQLTLINLKNLKKKSSRLFPWIAFGLLIGNYHICNYFYPTNSESDVSGWWDLKNDIYTLIISILFIYASIGKKGLYRLVLDIFTGLAIANTIDRFLFDIREFRENDLILIFLTIAFALYNYINGNRIK